MFSDDMKKLASLFMKLVLLVFGVVPSVFTTGLCAKKLLIPETVAQFVFISAILGVPICIFYMTYKGYGLVWASIVTLVVSFITFGFFMLLLLNLMGS